MSKVSKGKVIKPSNSILDANGKPLPKTSNGEGKSPEDILKERKEQEAKEQESFLKALEEFKKDNSYLNEYKKNIKSVKDRYVLVRLLRYKKDTPIKSGILVPDPNTGELRLSSEVMGYITTNYAKVILSGDESYKPGDVVTLPYDDVRGFYKNPEWEDFMTALQSKGATPKPPADKRQMVPAYEVKLNHKKFVRPWLLREEPEDRITFLVNALEIETVAK